MSKPLRFGDVLSRWTSVGCSASMPHTKRMDIERTKQVGLYFASRVRDLYVVKFLKLLYYADFISVREVGQPITGDTYFHLPYGPVPSYIKDNIGALNAALKQSEANILEDIADPINSIFDGCLQLIPKGAGQVISAAAGVVADETKLSRYEKGLLDDIISHLGSMTTRQLVDQTHLEPPYTQTNPSMTIPYELAFQLDVKSILPSRTGAYDKEVAFSRFITS